MVKLKAIPCLFQVDATQTILPLKEEYLPHAPPGKATMARCTDFK